MQVTNRELVEGIINVSQAQYNSGHETNIVQGPPDIRTMVQSAFTPYLRGLQLFLCLPLSVILIQSATAHLNNPYAFLSAILKYNVVGEQGSMMVAVLFPVYQLLIAISILTRQFVGGALLGNIVMCLAFLFAQSVVLIRGDLVDCGCFGPLDNSLVSSKTLGRVLMLLAASVAALICERITHSKISDAANVTKPETERFSVLES